MMIKMKKKSRVLPLFAGLSLIVALGGAAVYAQKQLMLSRAATVTARPDVKIMLSGSVERANEMLALDKVTNVAPGEILHWRIASMNEGTGAAREYKAVGHVPAGTSFVAGSAVAEAGSTVTYSIDGGKTFSTQPIIEEKQVDGSVKRVPAPVAMYTDLRYEWTDALEAGGKVLASYKVRVK